MNAQHIPAPWQIDVRPDSSMEIQTQSGIPIAVLCLLRERDANARLIAAAPDLLAALQWTLQFSEDFAREHNNGPTMAACISKARAAIDRAAGQ